jgi:inosine-uridine nucleoside N-ribohydrolase
MLDESIEHGATVVAIGPWTNLALLAVARPGRLDGVPIVVMGGWIHPPAPGLPAWGPEYDWNVQCDTRAAEILFASGADLTVVTIASTLQTHLRAAHLPRLRAAGPLGALLARQAEAHGEEYALSDLGRAHAGLPDDLLNFHHDPLACAVALGWDGVTTDVLGLSPVMKDDGLRFEPDDDGRPARVVTKVDGDAFSERWLTAIEAAQPSL